MKKILLFFIFILLFGCDSIRNNDKYITLIDCPEVFFSSENSVYFDGDSENLDINMINYKASLNNYGFSNNCFADEVNNNFLIDLLIIVEPLNPKDKSINLPIFAILYDSEEKIIDRQYFKIKNNLIYDQQTSNYEVLDLIHNLNIIIENNKDIKIITIGFVKIN